MKETDPDSAPGPTGEKTPSSEENRSEKNGSGTGDRFHLDDETYKQIPDRFKSGSDPNAEKPSRPNRSGPGRPPLPPFKGKKSSPDGQPHEAPRSPRGRISPLLVLLLLAGAVWMFFSSRKESGTTLITWNGFYEQLDRGNIDTVTMKGNMLSGTFVSVPDIAADPGKLLPEQEQAHDHHEHRRGVHERARHRETAVVDGLVVAVGKEKRDEPEQAEQPRILFREPEQFSVPEERPRGKQHGAAAGADDQHAR